jgi:hypothetical protein
VRQGEPGKPLDFGAVLRFTSALPPAGVTIQLLPPDPAGKPIPILVRNGDHYTAHVEGGEYRVKKREDTLQAKGPAAKEPERPPEDKKVAAQGGGRLPDYDAVDQWALAATPADERSLAELSAYLAKGCKTDREKARAVYRWITDRIAYDAEWARDKKRVPLVQDPESVLRKRKTDCVGYANLFVDLATRMKVKAVGISGYDKPRDHKPGQPVTSTHTWNGVQLEGKWYLIDATYGAGGMSEAGFGKCFRGYYFCIDPEECILSHFPKDERWQLLEKPVSAREFAQWPCIEARLLEIVASAKGIREALKDRAEMVKPFRFGSRLSGDETRVFELPVQRFLQAGKEYRFAVRSKDFEYIALVTGDKKHHPLQKEGDVFRGSVTATEGKLRLCGRPAGSKRFDFILEYEVRPDRAPGVSALPSPGASASTARMTRTSRPASDSHPNTISPIN